MNGYTLDAFRRCTYAPMPKLENQICNVNVSNCFPQAPTQSTDAATSAALILEKERLLHEKELNLLRERLSEQVKHTLELKHLEKEICTLNEKLAVAQSQEHNSGIRNSEMEICALNEKLSLARAQEQHNLEKQHLDKICALNAKLSVCEAQQQHNLELKNSNLHISALNEKLIAAQTKEQLYSEMKNLEKMHMLSEKLSVCQTQGKHNLELRNSEMHISSLNEKLSEARAQDRSNLEMQNLAKLNTVNEKLSACQSQDQHQNQLKNSKMMSEYNEKLLMTQLHNSEMKKLETELSNLNEKLSVLRAQADSERPATQTSVSTPGKNPLFVQSIYTHPPSPPSQPFVETGDKSSLISSNSVPSLLAPPPRTPSNALPDAFTFRPVPPNFSFQPPAAPGMQNLVPPFSLSNVPPSTSAEQPSQKVRSSPEVEPPLQPAPKVEPPFQPTPEPPFQPAPKLEPPSWRPSPRVEPPVQPAPKAWQPRSPQPSQLSQPSQPSPSSATRFSPNIPSPPFNLNARLEQPQPQPAQSAPLPYNFAAGLQKTPIFSKSAPPQVINNIMDELQSLFDRLKFSQQTPEVGNLLERLTNSQTPDFVTDVKNLLYLLSLNNTPANTVEELRSLIEKLDLNTPQPQIRVKSDLFDPNRVKNEPGFSNIKSSQTPPQIRVTPPDIKPYTHITPSCGTPTPSPRIRRPIDTPTPGCISPSVLAHSILPQDVRPEEIYFPDSDEIFAKEMAVYSPNSFATPSPSQTLSSPQTPVSPQVQYSNRPQQPASLLDPRSRNFSPRSFANSSPSHSHTLSSPQTPVSPPVPSNSPPNPGIGVSNNNSDEIGHRRFVEEEQIRLAHQANERQAQIQQAFDEANRQPAATHPYLNPLTLSPEQQEEMHKRQMASLLKEVNTTFPSNENIIRTDSDNDMDFNEQINEEMQNQAAKLDTFLKPTPSQHLFTPPHQSSQMPVVQQIQYQPIPLPYPVILVPPNPTMEPMETLPIPPVISRSQTAPPSQPPPPRPMEISGSQISPLRSQTAPPSQQTPQLPPSHMAPQIQHPPPQLPPRLMEISEPQISPPRAQTAPPKPPHELPTRPQTELPETAPPPPQPSRPQTAPPRQTSKSRYSRRPSSKSKRSSSSESSESDEAPTRKEQSTPQIILNYTPTVVNNYNNLNVETTSPRPNPTPSVYPLPSIVDVDPDSDDSSVSASWITNDRRKLGQFALEQEKKIREEYERAEANDDTTDIDKYLQIPQQQNSVIPPEPSVVIPEQNINLINKKKRRTPDGFVSPMAKRNSAKRGSSDDNQDMSLGSNSDLIPEQTEILKEDEVVAMAGRYYTENVVVIGDDDNIGDDDVSMSSSMPIGQPPIPSTNDPRPSTSKDSDPRLNISKEPDSYPTIEPPPSSSPYPYNLRTRTPVLYAVPPDEYHDTVVKKKRRSVKRPFKNVGIEPPSILRKEKLNEIDYEVPAKQRLQLMNGDAVNAVGSIIPALTDGYEIPEIPRPVSSLNALSSPPPIEDCSKSFVTADARLAFKDQNLAAKKSLNKIKNFEKILSKLSQDVTIIVHLRLWYKQLKQSYRTYLSQVKEIKSQPVHFNDYAVPVLGSVYEYYKYKQQLVAVDTTRDPYFLHAECFAHVQAEAEDLKTIYEAEYIPDSSSSVSESDDL